METMECSTTCGSLYDDSDDHNNNNKAECDVSKEAEGVWSSDIEKSFTEALSLYPPCGRRKIVLSEEGKMYGRNELIARYIKMQTGKTRSRKQVSSHIQVLARRKSKDIQSHLHEKHSREHARHQLAHMSSAQIVSDFKLSESLAQAAADNHESSSFIAHSVSNFTNSQIMSRFSSIPHPSSLVSNSKSFDNSSFLRQTSASQMQPCSNTSKLYIPIESPTEHLVNSHSQIPNMWAIPRLSRPSSQSDLSLHAGPHLKVGRSIATSKIRLIELCAFLEADDSLMKQDKNYSMKNYWKHVFANLNAKDINLFPPFLENIEISQIWDKYPESDGLKDFFEKGPQDAFFMVKFWIDINIEVYPQCNQAWTIIFEGVENVKIKLSTKLCSFGRQVLERIEEKSPIFENGVFIYRFENESMCDYMRKFIVKLSSLEERSMMNSVLENFTILQTVVNAFTGEILLCIAFAMEVSVTDQGSQYHIYKLIRHTNMVPPLNNI